MIQEEITFVTSCQRREFSPTRLISFNKLTLNGKRAEGGRGRGGYGGFGLK